MKSEGKITAASLWKQASKWLTEKYGDVFSQFLCHISALSIEEKADSADKTITLGVPGDYLYSIILDNYLDIVVSALKSVDCSCNCNLVVVEEQILSATEKNSVEDDNTAKSCRSSEEYTFGNFIQSSTNMHAYFCAKSVAEAPGRFNPLFIYGGSGTGKTHLLRALARELKRNFPTRTIKLVTGDEMISDFYDSLRGQRTSAFRRPYCDADILLVDDIHSLINKNELQNEFFNIFNTLHNANKQIVMTCDRHPSELKGVVDRLISRFGSGMVAEIGVPEYDARVAIMRMWRENLMSDCRLSDEILEFLAESIISSVRKLKGAFLRLTSTLSISRSDKQLTIEEARYILSKEIESELGSKVIPIETIQRVVADVFGITPHELLGRKRQRLIADARMVAMYLARVLTSHSTTEIGAAFSRDHATVIYAERKVPELCAQSEELRKRVASAKHTLGRY